MQAHTLADKSGETMKKLTIIAALAMAVAAFVVPSTASAVWMEDHDDLVANAPIHTEGSFSFDSGSAAINCTAVTSTIQLTGGQTTGHVNQFTAFNGLRCATPRGPSATVPLQR
jgi:hypothetical protein